MNTKTDRQDGLTQPLISSRRPGTLLRKPVVLLSVTCFLILAVIGVDLFFFPWKLPQSQPATQQQARSATQQQAPAQHAAVTQPGRPRVLPASPGAQTAALIQPDYYTDTVIVGGIAYTATDNTVYALRVNDGKVLWHTQIEGSMQRDELPLVVAGVVYVNSHVADIGPGHLYALRASDGAVLWHYIGNTAPVGSNSAVNYLYPPAVEHGILYLNEQDRGLTAFNANSGAILWHYAPKGQVYFAPMVSNGQVYISASVDMGVKSVTALRAQDGALLWQRQNTGNVLATDSHNGIIYAENAGTLVALRTGDGQPLWNLKFDADMLNVAQLVDGVLYFSTTKILLPTSTTGEIGGPGPQTLVAAGALWPGFLSVPGREQRPFKEGRSSIYAVGANTGKILWHYDLNQGQNSWSGWLALEQKTIYVGTIIPEQNANKSEIYALRSDDGALLWQDEAPVSSTNAIIANSMLYLSSGASQDVGAVYALHAGDGSLLWNYHLATALSSPPLLIGDALYLSATNGMVSELRIADGTVHWQRAIGIGT